jgi:hypothetical protein
MSGSRNINTGENAAVGGTVDTPENKLITGLKVFDSRCSDQFQHLWEELELTPDMVKSLDGDLAELETDAAFFTVPLLDVAGLKTEDGDVDDVVAEEGHFYQRPAVTRLWNEMDSTNKEKILFIQGQPGTGKSSAIWRKLLSMAAKEEKESSNILWVSLNRDDGIESAVYFQGRNYCKFRMQTVDELLIFIRAVKNIPLDVLFVDGISGTNAKVLHNAIVPWVERHQTRAIETSSSKVEKRRSHQNKTICYRTFLSWKLSEFMEAFVQSNKTTKVYDSCSTLFYEEYGLSAPPTALTRSETLVTNSTGGTPGAAIASETHTTNAEMSEDSANSEDSTISEVGNASKRLKQICVEDVLAAVGSRYEYTGGSARWMFNYSRKKIDSLLDQYCQEAKNRKAILQGEIGPTSDQATNYFFGSARENDQANVEYFLVSKRAVQILAEHTNGSSYEILYQFAEKLKNPSFVGWVVESDYFFQLEQAQKQAAAFSPRCISVPQPPATVPVSVLQWNHTKNKNLWQKATIATYAPKTKRKAAAKIKSIAEKLVPAETGKAIACKPTTWNQGGYDVFFVELGNHSSSGKTLIKLRFGQITKGQEHGYKAEYMYPVLGFFEEAGFEIESVEIAFVLTSHNVNSFELGAVTGYAFLKDYTIYGSSEKWTTVDCTNISKYELVLSKSNN